MTEILKFRAKAKQHQTADMRRGGRFRSVRKLFSRLWLIVLALIAVALLVTVLFDFAPNAQAETRFQICVQGKPANCVVDGDTIRVTGVKIRIEDIDTPEVFSPKCAYEAALGNRATNRLLELVNQGPFELVRSGNRDEDVYGRKLRMLTRGDQSLGAMLVAEGLARKWDGARHSWCV